jgi:hypothetical protein
VPGCDASGHGHWIPPSSSSRVYDIPACIGESVRSSSQAAAAVRSPQSVPSRFAICAMIQMSSRASPGGSSALRTRCTRRSEFVTVPSLSAHAAEAGNTTSAISAVFVMKMSCTIRQSRSSSSCFAWVESASLLTGFSPMQYTARSSPRSIAWNICVRCHPYFATMSTPHAFE